jgi:hypothetical protein
MGTGTRSVEDVMEYPHVARSERILAIARVTSIWVSVFLLPPFFILAIAPMLLVLVPVAIVAIPFIIPAMFSGSLTALSEQRQRASRRPLPRHLWAVN